MMHTRVNHARLAGGGGRAIFEWAGVSPGVARLVLIVVALGAWGVLAASTLGGVVGSASMIDFGSYRALAQAMLAHRDPYQIVASNGAPGPAAYPPIFGMLIMPFALLPLPLASLTWYAFTLGLLALGAVLAVLLGSRRDAPGGAAATALAAIVVVLFYPVWTNAKLGQVGALLFCLVVASVALRGSGRPMLGGALLGLAISIKMLPLPLVAFAIWIGWRRYSLASLTSFVGLQLVSAIWFPDLVDEYWLRVVPAIQKGLGPLSTNLALANVASQLLPARAGVVGALGLAVGGLALIAPFLVARRRSGGGDAGKRTLLGFALLMTGIEIAGPVVESHHLVWLILPFWLLILEVNRRPSPPNLALALGSLVCLSQPYRLARLVAAGAHLVGPPDLLGSAVLQLGVILLYAGLFLALLDTRPGDDEDPGACRRAEFTRLAGVSASVP